MVLVCYYTAAYLWFYSAIIRWRIYGFTLLLYGGVSMVLLCYYTAAYLWFYSAIIGGIHMVFLRDSINVIPPYDNINPKKRCIFYENHGNQRGFFHIKIIINVYRNYKYFFSYSAEIDFNSSESDFERSQILTTKVAPRTVRVNTN